jgi:hypothetical protein
MKVVAMPHLQELVVGGAHNDFDFELRDSLVIDNPAQSAWRKNISSAAVNLIGTDRHRAKLFHDAFNFLGINVARN